MFSHMHIGVTDFERAFTFYSIVLKELGLVLRFHGPGAVLGRLAGEGRGAALAAHRPPQ